MIGRNKLKEYDILTRQKKEKEFSVWKGSDGRSYFFKHMENQENKKAPIAQIYKNRKYFTGLFPTKKPNMFTGDIKTNQGRLYLLFSIETQERIKVFKRVG